MAEELKKEFSKLRFLDENGETYPEWEEKKVSDVFNISRGKVIAKSSVSQEQNELSKYPIYSSQTLNDGIMGYGKDYNFEGDSLTWTTDGAYAGKVRYRTGEYSCTNVCGVLQAKDDFSGMANKLMENIIGLKTPLHVVKVGNPKLMSNIMADIEISIPSLSEQTKIANFLSKIDEKIKAQAKLVELLKKQKQGYSQKIFNGSLRFKKDDGTDYDDWEVKKLGETIASGGSGGTPTSTNKKYYNGQYPFLAVSDITKQGKYLKSTEKSLTDLGVKNSGAWVVPANSLIYTLYASVGKMCINKEPITTSQALYAMKFNDTELLEYMYYAITEFNKKKINKFITTGTQANINANSLKSFEIPIPSLPEQEKIAAFLTNLDNRIDEELNKLEKLKLAKNGYMQRVLG